MHLGIIKITYNRTATHFMDDRFVNLGEEVILTLQWQSSASESATVCFVISLSICYWLFKCVSCVWEREGHSAASCVCVCRGAATDSGPPGQHIPSGPPAFRGGGGGVYITEIVIAFPSQSFFPLLPNQIILFQLLKSFSFVCNGKVIIFRFVFL